MKEKRDKWEEIMEYTKVQVFRDGLAVGYEIMASAIIDHPEIGAVLDSQCGAQSEGCAFDTPDRSRSAAPDWLNDILCVNERFWAAGQPGYIRAVLASDGWWWKV